MKVNLFCAILLTLTTIKATKSGTLIDNFTAETRSPQERNLDLEDFKSSVNNSGSHDSISMNSNTEFPKEQIDSDVDNEPKFAYSGGVDTNWEKLGEKEEVQKLKGKSIIQKVPSALHHRVVFPYTYPHVGMIPAHHGHETKHLPPPVEEYL